LSQLITLVYREMTNELTLILASQVFGHPSILNYRFNYEICLWHAGRNDDTFQVFSKFSKCIFYV